MPQLDNQEPGACDYKGPDEQHQDIEIDGRITEAVGNNPNQCVA